MTYLCKRNSKQVRVGERIIKVDSCLPIILKLLNDNPDVKTLASCCGHGKYHPSIVAKIKGFDFPIEIFSGEFIRRKKRFYTKDKEGFYYIPVISLAMPPEAWRNIKKED